ncbi:MAG: RHS repeat-associated core domain-containing protein [Flavobacteriales bacterium]|nr:RHS repeat-associated core domain-containing protein [Flavobacteriales bacterium]
MNITNTSWAVNNEMTYHNDLERVAKFSQYDNHGQPECFSKEHNVPTSILWADIDKPNAKIVNALPNECLFIDFDLNKYVPATFNEFFLTPGYVGNSYQINSQELQINQNFPAGRYKLSFWAKGLNGQLKLNGSVIESIQAGSEFEFIEVEINYNSTINLLSLSGTGIIDEIRIHPLDAQMITFSYDRNHKTLIGTSTIQHQKQTFEYDDFMRLKNIFDSEDNLLTNNEYIYNEAITGLNVIKKHTARSPGFNHESQLQSNSNINEVLHEIQYIDDFGRIIQSIAVGDSPSEKDIVSIHDYDALGREKKQYLHFTATSNGGLYRGNAELLQNLFYGSLSSHAYSENSLENAPGGKLVETGHPGSAWKIGSGHEIKNDYRFNYPKEIRLFNSFGVSTTTYASNRLRVVQTEDENGHKTTTYMDQSGRTIMTDQSGAKTYFVFDDFGRTRFVIPPMAYKEMENTGIYNCNIPSIQNAIYHYVYDNLGNVIRKKIPGKNVELTFYDRLSRPVLTIDGKGKKSFIKYDILGRSIVTGLYSGSAMPSISDSLYEEESTTNFGYTLNNSFPSNQITVLGVDYYDHYDFDRDGIVSAQESYYKDPQDTFNNEFFDHPINKITGSLIAFFEPGSDSVDGYTVTKSYYDSRLRPIQSKMINRTGVEDMVFNLYDFKGNIIKTSKLHRSNLTTTNSFIISKDYEYDHGGRLLKTFVQINNGPKNLVSSKSYNEKGLLSSKKLGLDSLGLNYLQKLDYTYNVRNWLTGINDIDANCGAFDKFETPQIGEYTSRSVSNIYRTKMPKNVDNDLFSMRIAYNQTRHADALFDGNISEVTWQNECGSIARHYDFSYDSRNQLIAAKYYEGTDLNNLVETDEYSMSASYDLNGNLLSLKRNGQGNEIDNLSYTYNSANHLIQLEELADLSKGFQSQFNSASFHYDLNGNLSRDEHKGLDVNHNLFNLPNTFAFDSGDSIQIQFDASGKKLAKLTKENGQNNWMRKDYFGEFEYVDGNLEAIYFEEGRIVPIGSKWQFEYVIRDYLGNIRLSFADLNEDQKIDINDNEVLQENHYYPFGMTMEGPWQQISGTENAYQYNGKEMNNDFGLRWLDYGARWYDPAIGRWHSVDPLAEKFMNWSAYNYVFNNPVRLIDPDGAAPNDPIEQYRQLFQRVFKQAPKSVAKALFLRLQSLRESRKYGMQEMQADDYFEPITGVGQGALYRSGSIATNDLKGIISLNINGISVKGRIGGYKKKYSSLTNVSSIVFNSGRLGKGTSGGTTQAVSGFQIELKNSKTSVAYILIQDKAIFEAIRDSYYAAIEKEFQKLLNSNPELSDYYELMKAYQDAMDEYNKVRALNAREKSEKQQSKYDAAASRYEKTNERFKSLQRSFYRKYPN